MKRFLIVAGVLLGATLLSTASYYHLRAQSDALVAKIPEPFDRISSRFCFFTSLTGHHDPSWEFSYDPRNSFPTAPLTIQMSLWGRPIATNPRTALAELRRLP